MTLLAGLKGVRKCVAFGEFGPPVAHDLEHVDVSRNATLSDNVK